MFVEMDSDGNGQIEFDGGSHAGPHTLNIQGILALGRWPIAAIAAIASQANRGGSSTTAGPADDTRPAVLLRVRQRHGQQP